MMKNVLNQPCIQRLEIAAWDVAINSMTHSRLVQKTIRDGVRLSHQVDWKKDPKIVGLVASGGLAFGSSFALLTLLIH
jgi:hypothetical protein